MQLSIIGLLKTSWSCIGARKKRMHLLQILTDFRDLKKEHEAELKKEQTRAAQAEADAKSLANAITVLLTSEMFGRA